MENKFKKKRSSNFTVSEENLLIKLIKKWAKEIDNKENDNNSNILRNNAWDELCGEFNAISAHEYRDVQVLKNKYNNLKKRSIYRHAYEENFLRRTDKHPFQAFSDDTDLDKDILGSQMSDFSPDYDDDNCDEDFAEIKDDPLQPIEINNEDGSIYIELNARTATPQQPTTCEVLEETGKESSQASSNVEKLLSSKQELLALQKQCFKEEHRIKVKLMEEKHKHTLILEKSEHAEKIRQMREEHALKMEILKIQKSILMDE